MDERSPDELARLTEAVEALPDNVPLRLQLAEAYLRASTSIGTIVRELHGAEAARARACASLSAPEHLKSACRRGAGLTP